LKFCSRFEKTHHHLKKSFQEIRQVSKINDLFHELTAIGRFVRIVSAVVHIVAEIGGANTFGKIRTLFVTVFTWNRS
jgi:hypothetical protein